MVDVAHKNLTGVSLHEPKGVATATADKVYVADGAGSGTWEKITVDSIDATSIKNTNLVAFTYTFQNISTASSQWVVAPFAGDIKTIQSVLHGAISAGDATISFEIAGTPVTSGSLTITQSGSAAGDVDTSTPSADKTVTAGQAIEIISDGASGNAVNLTITFILDVA
jgi:hypothetical protein